MRLGSREFRLNRYYIFKKAYPLYLEDTESFLDMLNKTKLYIDKNFDKFYLTDCADNFFKEACKQFSESETALKMLFQIFLTKFILLSELDFNEKSVQIFLEVALGHTQIKGDL